MQTFSNKYKNSRVEFEVTTHKHHDDYNRITDEEYIVFGITEYNSHGHYEGSMHYALDKPEIEELITFLQGVK